MCSCSLLLSGTWCALAPRSISCRPSRSSLTWHSFPTFSLHLERTRVKVERGEGPSVFRRMNANTAIQVLVRSCVCVCVCVCVLVCGWVVVHVVHEHERTMTCVVLCFITWTRGHTPHSHRFQSFRVRPKLPKRNPLVWHKLSAFRFGTLALSFNWAGDITKKKRQG
jgi:hypothetical protein